MKSLRTYSATWLKSPLDLLISALTLLAAWWLADRGIPFDLSHGTPPLAAYYKAMVVFLLIFLVTAFSFRFYRARRAGSYGQLALDVLKVNGQTTLIALAISFYYRDFSYSRLILTTFFLLNPLLIGLHHVLWLARERRLHRKGIGTRSCLIVGSGELARALARRVNERPWTGLRIAGFIDPDLRDDSPAVPRNRILGHLESLEAILTEHGIQEVMVAVPFSSMGTVAEIDQRLSETTIGLRWVPDLEALNTLSREFADLDGMHVINLRGVRDYGANAFTKRAFDIVVSSLLLVVLSPLLAAIAIVVRFSSGRPVLYKQERMGLDGHPFTMLKFRTMRLDAEKRGPVFADARDPRCTRIGHLLRVTSFDELPQLWNVLRGEMSLVGPRPERPVFIDEFKKTIPGYMLRHRMKAGLTGWAQVNGWRGKTSLHKRLQFDLYYLKNWSLLFDVKILLLTMFRAWTKHEKVS